MNEHAVHPSVESESTHLVFLSPHELRELYADAAAQVQLIGGLLRIAERVSRSRGRPVAIPLKLQQTQTTP